MLVSTLLTAGVILVRTGSPPPIAQQVEIRVKSSWSGLSVIQLNRTPPPTDPTDYSVVCNLEDCAEPVRKLLSILNSPPKPNLQLEDFDTLASWLRSADPAELRGESGYREYSNAPQAVREAFDALRADTGEIRKVLIGYFDPQGFWTDDYPFVSVNISLPGGRLIQASSSSQKAFMIPWQVTAGDVKYQTFDPDIGRALAALAPPRFEEADRLSGRHLKTALVSRVMRLAWATARKGS